MSNTTNNNQDVKYFDFHSQDVKYFNIHVIGIGYLNRARTVNPDKGDAYESVSISALHGRSDSPSYSYFDTRVVGGEAFDFVKTYKGAINDRDSKVLVRFKVGDAEATSYEVKSGDKKGNRNHVIKARLLQITWASINGEVVLNMAGHEGGDAASDEAQHSPANASAGNNIPTDTPAPPAAAQSQEVESADVVKLERDDPEFAAKRAKLKAAGYRWDKDDMVWRRQAQAA